MVLVWLVLLSSVSASERVVVDKAVAMAGSGINGTRSQLMSIHGSRRLSRTAARG